MHKSRPKALNTSDFFVFRFFGFHFEYDLTTDGGLSLSDESFPNEGARGAFAKPSRSLQEGSAKPSRSVSSRRLRGASKAPPRTLRGGLRTLRGGCTYRRFHEDALEGSRGLLEGSVDELYVIMTVIVFGQYYTVFRTV